MNIPTGGLPVDIVLFAMIAVFLVLRLRSVLGRRTGFEQQPVAPARQPGRPAPVLEGRAEPAQSPTARGVPAPDTPAGQALARIRAQDRGFDPERFLQGAEQAFRTIVAEFAAGRRDSLRPLLTSPTYAAFEKAITEREAAEHTQRSEIRHISSVAIEQAILRETPGGGSVAEIEVRFISDQTSLTLAKDGQFLIGTDAVTEMRDVWTFERDLAGSEKSWRLAAARSA